MSLRVGQARKRDANEQAIVDALEAVGAAVFKLSGAGVPDLLVAYRGRWTPLEVKSKTGTLTPRQVDSRFRAGPIPVARTVEEALQAIGVQNALARVDSQ
jgi:hypothetical protein